MKKILFRVAMVCALSSTLLLTSCLGKFGLTTRLWSWNNTVGNKFVNELVFVAFNILPVYPVSVLADILVLNSIEFWSGEDPLASETKTVKGRDGEYLVQRDHDGYTITSLADNSVVRLDFDYETQTWSEVVNGERHVLFTFVDDNRVALPSVDGEMQEVELSAAGVSAYSRAAASTLFASR